jgi:predicted transposase YdaD
MSNPHDKLVRRTFGDVQHARGLLQSLLPPELVGIIDWQSLTALDGSFIDPQLSERQTDLLYSVRMDGRETLLYVLLEHQSSVDRWMALRMVVYMTRIWLRYSESHQEAQRLPLVVPLVLHHSAHGWTAATAMDELLDIDPAVAQSLGTLVPQFRFLLVDLTRLEDRAVRAWLTTALGTLVALCLKYGSTEPDLKQRLPEWLDLFARVIRAPGGVGALDVIARYILEVNDITFEDLRDVLDSALEPEAVAAIMTGAEKLRAEGRVEGRVQGRAELVLKQLALRFGVLSESIEARVRGASVEQLDGFAERVLTAQSLDQVLGSK